MSCTYAEYSAWIYFSMSDWQNDARPLFSLSGLMYIPYSSVLTILHKIFDYLVFSDDMWWAVLLNFKSEFQWYIFYVNLRGFRMIRRSWLAKEGQCCGSSSLWRLSLPGVIRGVMLTYFGFEYIRFASQNRKLDLSSVNMVISLPEHFTWHVT